VGKFERAKAARTNSKYAQRDNLSIVKKRIKINTINTHMTSHFPALVQVLQFKVAGLDWFMGPSLPSYVKKNLYSLIRNIITKDKFRTSSINTND
jgi:hypothetical protein